MIIIFILTNNSARYWRSKQNFIFEYLFKHETCVYFHSSEFQAFELTMNLRIFSNFSKAKVNKFIN